MQNSPLALSSVISCTSSSLTQLKRLSTLSSYAITARANSTSFLTKESTLSVTILVAAAAISLMWILLLTLLFLINFAISAISYAWSPMRSISEIILSAEDITLKSRATGCCSSNSFIQIDSISRSLRLISSSVSTAFWQSASSSSKKPFTDALMASSQSAPIVISSKFSFSS